MSHIDNKQFVSKHCSNVVTTQCIVCAQQEEVKQKAKDLEKTVSQLQKSLEEGCALMKEKDIRLEMQAKRETELIASVHRYIINQYLS